MGKKRALLRKKTSISASDVEKSKKSRLSVGEDEKASLDNESETEEIISLVHKDNDHMEEFTFEFYDMKASFVESIASLCQGLFANSSLAYEAATAIVGQDDVGTAVLCEEGEDVFGYATILCQSTITSSSCIQRLLADLLQAIQTTMPKDQEAIDGFSKAITGDKRQYTGVLLHRRFPNFPVQLIHSLYENLQEDMLWIKSQSAAEDSVALELKAIQQFIVISTCSSNETTIRDGTAMRADRSIIYDDFEDEVFVQQSDISIVYRPVSSKILLCASIVPWRNLKDILSEIKQLCSLA